jgi:predicted GH43/DUF377 family glycosyl hydrolase
MINQVKSNTNGQPPICVPVTVTVTKYNILTVEQPPVTVTTTQAPVTILPVTVTETPITVTVTRHIQTLNRFASYAELRAWLDEVQPEMRAARQPGWNCTNAAWWLVERAQADGWLMVYHGIKAEAYNSVFTNLQLDGAHAITATYINGSTYLIEPTGFEVFPSWEVTK